MLESTRPSKTARRVVVDQHTRRNIDELYFVYRYINTAANQGAFRPVYGIINHGHRLEKIHFKHLLKTEPEACKRKLLKHLISQPNDTVARAKLNTISSTT